MTAQTTMAPRRWLRLSPVDLTLAAILSFILLSGFKGAFGHMHAWTVHELDDSGQGWTNAVISELMPTAAFLLIQKRRVQERGIGGPMVLFWGAALLSLVANLTATGWYPPGGKQLLAVLPMLVVLVVGELVLRDAMRSGKLKAARLAEAERRAELDRRRAEQAAELRAEQARKLAAERAEQAAELARIERAHAAELERERLAVEQAGITERARIEAAERAEVRRAEQQREEREQRARLEREAAAARVVAEAVADRERAEAERIRVAAAAQEQAAAMLVARQATAAEAGRHRDDDGSGNVRAMRQRRPRHETQAMADAALSLLQPGTSRDEAVKVVAQAIGNTERYAREFVPADWAAGASAGGEAEDAA